MSFALFLSRSRDISQHQAAYYGDDPDQTYNSPADWRIFFYFTVQLVGALGLTLLLATMIWPSKFRRPRNPLLISLCASWWISTFPCLCLLYYAGQVTGPPPSFKICLTSATLTMSQSVLVATTAPALVCHVCPHPSLHI
ncbi:hypothetical protein NLI96_g1706 [Meripilus lineatus]|uniref:Uncharacterized protein n=1 Tax=Meripilus lineatus TaxID=2056292 RepID=A0AAD5YI43_9APHY|nr:hypothetical protein NLI96_g1706 [Physisporinus lineatus]